MITSDDYIEIGTKMYNKASSLTMLTWYGWREFLCSGDNVCYVLGR